MATATNPFNDFVFLDATPAERGTFTLALDKALEKLEKFQLPDPRFYILQWIQAIVASGAENIWITSKNTDTIPLTLRILFDGPGYTEQELGHLYDHVFLSGRDRSVDRLRELALGWLSASSLHPDTLKITSNGWSRTHKPDGLKTKGDLASAPWAEGSNHCLEIFYAQSYGIKEIITTHCAEVPIPVFLDQDQVSRPGISTGVPWPNRSFENANTQGVMGATYGTDAKTQLTFLRYGVSFISRVEPDLKPAVMLRVSDPTLSKNVSQTDLVRDEAYEEFLARVRSEMKKMAIELSQSRIPSYQRDSLNRYLQAYLVSHLDIRVLQDPERLKLLGPEFARLLSQPVFTSTKGVYRSLQELYEHYQKFGFLAYCAEPRARAFNWTGVLLILDDEEAPIVRKFFPNLIELSIEDVQQQIASGKQDFVDETFSTRILLTTKIMAMGRGFQVEIPDAYPTGQAVLIGGSGRLGALIPGLPLTMMLRNLHKSQLTHSDIVGVVQTLRNQLPRIKDSLAKILRDTTVDTNFTHQRAAELLCEILNDEITRSPSNKSEIIKSSRQIPIIGLENGKLASLDDLSTYLELIPEIYLGGAFIEGLDSGALDPMPQALKLLTQLYPSKSFQATSKIRDRLSQDPNLSLALRRQTLIVGLSSTTVDPKLVLERFANDAAREAAEIARIEREFRKTIDNPDLFIKPDEARLTELAAETSQLGTEVPLVDLTATPIAPPSASPSDTTLGACAPEIQVPHEILPSIINDLDLCRSKESCSFIAETIQLHLERQEPSYSIYLVGCRPGQGKVLLLQGHRVESASTQQAVQGFLRIRDQAPSSDFKKLLSEGLEQLTIKAIHQLDAGPTSTSSRTFLQQWILELSCHNPKRTLAARGRTNELFDLPIVPCLGSKLLSWRVLLEQAERTGQTLVSSGPATLKPNPDREVILLSQGLTPELLSTLGFPQLVTYTPQVTSNPFETLYRSTRRDLLSALWGQTTPLLNENITNRLASDASLWKRWRAGFLSWDPVQEAAVLNPDHKIGQKLTLRFKDDPSWSLIFASALFSTINRGLEEVDDHHERSFLEALIESLD